MTSLDQSYFLIRHINYMRYNNIGHLIHRFNISEPDWHRIKQNIDSKCRTAFQYILHVYIAGHLIHRFNISEPDWHRIKQNIDSKCRTAFRYITCVYCRSPDPSVQHIGARLAQNQAEHWLQVSHGVPIYYMCILQVTWSTGSTYRSRTGTESSRTSTRNVARCSNIYYMCILQVIWSIGSTYRSRTGTESSRTSIQSVARRSDANRRECRWRWKRSEGRRRPPTSRCRTRWGTVMRTPCRTAVWTCR